MEFIIDTVNLEDIKEAVEYMPIVGVTSNPSIVKKTSPKRLLSTYERSKKNHWKRKKSTHSSYF